MRILVHTSVGHNTGYGRDGIGLLKELLDKEHSIDLNPGTVTPPLPPSVAELFMYPIDSTGYDLEIHHCSPGSAPGPSGAAKQSVLWTMHEFDDFGPDFPGYSKAKSSLPRYDMVVGYTQQTLDALTHLMPDNSAVLQGGIETDPWGPTSRSSAGAEPFRFAMVGHLNMRKNVPTVLRAFNRLREEFGEEVELILKTGYPVLPPNMEAPGVKVVRDINLSVEEMKRFYGEVDCLINVSWGEGKDLPALEATLCETPTILNDTPGHRQWMHPSIQSLVPTTTLPMLSDGTHIGRYSSVDEVYTAMAEQLTTRSQHLRRAGQLASYVRGVMSWEHKVKKFGEIIGIPSLGLQSQSQGGRL